MRTNHIRKGENVSIKDRLIEIIDIGNVLIPCLTIKELGLKSRGIIFRVYYFIINYYLLLTYDHTRTPGKTYQIFAKLVPCCQIAMYHFRN